MNATNYAEMGAEAGKSAGSWIIDGNTSVETCAAILAGLEDGDPQVMDMMPAPLSGEMAGESIPEIFGLAVGEDWPTDGELAEYEDAYSLAFWDTVEAACRYQVTE